MIECKDKSSFRGRFKESTMADKASTGTDGKSGKKQEKKSAGARSSSSAHKAGIVRTHMGLPLKKLRRVFKVEGEDAAKAYASAHGLMAEWRKIEASGLVERRYAAWAGRLAAQLARRIARQSAKMLAKAAEAARAKRSEVAKKAVATRKAKKLAASAASEQTATA